MSRVLVVVGLLVASQGLCAQTQDITGQPRSYRPLNDLVRNTPRVTTLEVVASARTAGITFRPVADLKGKSSPHNVVLNVSRFSNDNRDLLEWASPGRRAIGFFDKTSLTLCLGNAWMDCE